MRGRDVVTALAEDEFKGRWLLGTCQKRNAAGLLFFTNGGTDDGTGDGTSAGASQKGALNGGPR